MKHVVIVGHPDPESFNLAVARRYMAAVEGLGHEAVLRDLYRLDFDPRLRSEEIPGHPNFAPGADVAAERALIGDAQVFVFIYPLWFYDRPAILKGYIDRVFGMGFGYGPIAHGGNTQRLSGRRMLSFTSSGAPTDWLQEEGTLDEIRSLLDAHFARVCGLEVLDHLHFGEITESLSDTGFDECMTVVDSAVARMFGS